MKIARSLAILTGLVIIGLNVSAQTMDPEQTAQKETTEIKTNVTGITSNEESQILTVEREHAKSMWDARNTLTDKVALKTQTKELCVTVISISFALTTYQKSFSFIFLGVAG